MWVNYHLVTCKEESEFVITTNNDSNSTISLVDELLSAWLRPFTDQRLPTWSLIMVAKHFSFFNYGLIVMGGGGI